MKTLLKAAAFLLIGLASQTALAQVKGTFTDPRDGHVYKTVKIGGKLWMAENMVYKVEDMALPASGKEEDAKVYGYFYRYSDAFKLCPEGWALPGRSDITRLRNAVCPDIENCHKKLNRLGFNLTKGGYFDAEKDKYFDFDLAAWLWTSNDAGNEATAQFFREDYLGERDVLKASYMPVRCIKFR